MTPTLKQKLTTHYGFTPLLRSVSFDGIIINDFYLLTPTIFINYCGALCFKSHLPQHQKIKLQKVLQKFINQEDLSLSLR